MADRDGELSEWIARANREALPSAERLARVRERVMAGTPPSSGSGSTGSSGTPAPANGAGSISSGTFALGGLGAGAAVAMVIALVATSSPAHVRPMETKSDDVAVSVETELEAPAPEPTIRAPAPEVEPVVAPEPTPPQQPRRLRDETQLIAGALEAIRAGDGPRARRLLDEHARRYPDGLLADERETARERLRETPGDDHP